MSRGLTEGCVCWVKGLQSYFFLFHFFSAVRKGKRNMCEKNRQWEIRLHQAGLDIIESQVKVACENLYWVAIYILYLFYWVKRKQKA